MKRSIDGGGSSKAFLVIQLTITMLMALAFNPLRTGHLAWSFPSILLGMIGGILLFTMMSAIGRAMECGPPGLTLAALNSATVMPAIIMALIFGTQKGFPYTLSHGIGSILVIGGLFWAGKTSERGAAKRRWVRLVTIAFIAHIGLLILLQWRALLLAENLLPRENSQWFHPSLFFTAALFMGISFIKNEKRMFSPKERVWGTLGGLLNGVSMFLILIAPEIATPPQQAMIFPIFAVGLILINNSWGQALYKERVNWYANALCLAGIIIGTVNWSQM